MNSFKFTTSLRLLSYSSFAGLDEIRGLVKQSLDCWLTGCTCIFVVVLGTIQLRICKVGKYAFV